MYQRFRQPFCRSFRASDGIVAVISVAGVAAHVAAAMAGPPGVMAWLMGGMAAVCLAVVIPATGGRFCSGRSAGHLLTMNAGMIFVHLVLLTSPTALGHHVSAGPGEGRSLAGHEHGMLALMAFELLCLAAASAALRLSRLEPLRGFSPARKFSPGNARVAPGPTLLRLLYR